MSVTMDDGLVSRDSLDRRVASGLDFSEHLFARKGDLVYNTMRMWQGVSGVAPEDCVVSPAYVICQPTELVDSNFSGHLMKSDHLIRVLRGHSQGLTNDRLRLYFHHFAKIRVALPPLPEQKKIADILSSVDEAIQVKKAVIEQTRQVKEGLLQDLLAKGIGHVRFRETEIGEIPESWDLVRLGHIARVFNGKGSKSGGSCVRLYKSKHVYDGPVISDNPEYQPDDLLDTIPDWAYLRDGDVLTPNIAHSTIGRVAWIQSVDEPSLCDGQVMVIRSRDLSIVRPRFLFDFLSAQLGRHQLLAREVGSIFGPARGQTHLYPKDVETLWVALPAIAEQDAIGRSIWLDRKVEQQTALLGELHRVKAGLLQDLLTGKVRVSV